MRRFSFRNFSFLVLVACVAPVVPTFAADRIPAENGDILISAQVHASVQIEYQDLVIQVDPWSAIDLANYLPADIILITDSSGHHRDLEAIAALRDEETIVIVPANSADVLPSALVMANGEQRAIGTVNIEAVAAYDIIPGAPEHPKGDANGYVIELGGKRLFFAGVTECVDEVRALDDIDVAFLPMNIPPGRMTPEATAECARALAPDIVYTYHFDQSYARRVGNPEAEALTLPGDISVDESVEQFTAELAGSGIEYREAHWYPPRFELVKDWPQTPLGQRWLTGGLGGICTGPDDRVFLLNRQNVVEEDLDAARLAPPIIELDAQGAVVRGWGEPERIGGRLHDCHAGQNGELWLVPAATGHVQKWTVDGNALLMQIGASDRFDSSDGSRSGQPLNSASAQFFLPAAIDVDTSNGDIYVADGELPGGNTRIAVFNSDGEFQRQWRLQRLPHEDAIELPHCLRLSNDGLVYVCDRRADRVQVFDKQGQLVQQIEMDFSSVSASEGRISGTRGNAVVLAFSHDPEQRYLYVVNQNTVMVEVWERKSGELVTRFGGGPGRYPGQFELPHGIAVDSQGNIYVAEQEGRRVQKFRWLGE
jgi:L-ascorbate metabolism protein UlaG (beta-lactamase superfamily)